MYSRKVERETNPGDVREVYSYRTQSVCVVFLKLYTFTLWMALGASGKMGRRTKVGQYVQLGVKCVFSLSHSLKLRWKRKRSRQLSLKPSGPQHRATFCWLSRHFFDAISQISLNIQILNKAVFISVNIFSCPLCYSLTSILSLFSWGVSDSVFWR